jgi:hypothetical protein
MRFLANENFPRAAVEALRIEGHDTGWIRTDAPGATDEQDDWHGHFNVVEPERIRMRPLPAA